MSTPATATRLQQIDATHAVTSTYATPYAILSILQACLVGNMQFYSALISPGLPLSLGLR